MDQLTIQDNNDITVEGPGSWDTGICSTLERSRPPHHVSNVGDIYQRVDTTPGPRLFVKESDAQPGTGWASK